MPIMMIAVRAMTKGALLVSFGLALGFTATPAGASPRHHHHWIRVTHRHVPRRAIFPDQDSAAATRAAGFVTGYVDAGILGATTADPYEHRSYGYDIRGRRGPGYDYYGE